MQTTETDIKNHKLRSDEEAINFRPSPNFKHMKKYLKSKFEESSNPSTPNGNEDTNCRYDDLQQEDNGNHKDIQPPLPPNPPPPDSPPSVMLKKEIEDDDYNDLSNSPSEMSSDTNKSEELVKYKTQAGDGKGNGEEIMCRNFIRGTCNRGASCIFAHKVILSQLAKVYKFCNDFQNIGCKRRNCNFVHATVFERESFLRTAYLPPHTLSHLNKTTTIQPPPPLSEASPANVLSTTGGNQPPPPILGSVTPLPMMSCAPTATVSVDSRATLGDVFRAASVAETTSLKREWADMDDFSSSPRDYDCTETEAKKCKHCGMNEFRLQFIKTKTKNLQQSNDELNKKIAVINNKGQRLLTVLATMIKSVLHKSKAPGSSTGFLNITEEKEQVLREQVALLSSVSAFSEENTKNLNSGNPGLQSFLAKLLIGSMDPLLSPDGS